MQDSLATGHWIELAAVGLVELVVQIALVVLPELVVLSAFAAELGHESTHWSAAALL